MTQIQPIRAECSQSPVALSPSGHLCRCGGVSSDPITDGLLITDNWGQTEFLLTEITLSEPSRRSTGPSLTHTHKWWEEEVGVFAVASLFPCSIQSAAPPLFAADTPLTHTHTVDRIDSLAE